MVTLIYPYRNRSLDRIKKSLDSLKEQDSSQFEVKFIDYGTNLALANRVKKLVESYRFCTYQYSYTEYQPWNKSRALNIIIKQLTTDFCFVADIDMMFANNFVSKLNEVKNSMRATYFQVGFLSEEESKKNIPFKDYVPKFLSNSEATGLTLFPVKKLQELNGFDEFFHFWGAEDTDIHHRLRNYGVDVKYFDDEVLMLHQWHVSFPVNKKRQFNKEFDLDNVALLNHKHKDMNLSLGVTKVNENGWGEVLSSETFELLNGKTIDRAFSNKKTDVDYMINSFFSKMKNQIIGLEVIFEPTNNIKNLVKTTIGKRVEKYYTMKEVNNLLLTHIIAHLRNKSYIYKVAEDGLKITLKIET